MYFYFISFYVLINLLIISIASIIVAIKYISYEIESVFNLQNINIIITNNISNKLSQGT